MNPAGHPWTAAASATSSGSYLNFGEKSQYVKNIKANPTVRVRLRGRWHNGTAHLMPDDDPRTRLRQLPRANSFAVRTFGTSLLTICVDLID